MILKLFGFLKLGTLLPIIYIFMSPKFSISKKSQGPFKINIFVENLLIPSFYFIELLPKLKFGFIFV